MLVIRLSREEKTVKTSRLIASLALVCLAVGTPEALSDGRSDTPVEDYIRLHVVAHSDSAWDQGVKLAVRDAVREEAGRLLETCASAEEAWAAVQAHSEALAEAAQTALNAWGAPYEASVRAGVFEFPKRRYGGQTVPAGEYRAVRVALGVGQGKNWWCVLFPSLCLPAEADETAPVVFYSRLGRWLSRLFGRDAA